MKTQVTKIPDNTQGKKTSSLRHRPVESNTSRANEELKLVLHIDEANRYLLLHFSNSILGWQT
ncbi:hypothetical protein [Streptomyces sp. NBC_00986]|uniref:hypothetical protein n=1 Tax=Streptomyces sp. NBC_00986 TaxID=2903702 RepID=UPI00386837EA|nr:hypothetical protein OG504_18425 [Streptomyces sp. NBC_00986]